MEHDSLRNWNGLGSIIERTGKRYSFDNKNREQIVKPEKK